MKEREFLGWILDVAARGGWRSWHIPMPVRPIGDGKFVPERRAKGLPDLILLHHDPPRLIFAEVKRDGKPLSDEQAEFLRLARGVSRRQRDLFRAAEDLARAGAEAAVLLGSDPITVEHPGEVMTALIGAYSWRPGNEELIEAILLNRVMIP